MVRLQLEVINMVSTSIPDSLKVKIKSRFGNFNTGQVYAAAGQSGGRLGYLLGPQ